MPQLADRLAAAGFLSARAEAEELRAVAGGDDRVLEELVERRLTGEPLAWIVGSAAFCGLRVRVAPGVYVPRPHTERLALRAAERLPADGTAVDVCTGSGVVAAVLADRRPAATVIATDVEERAVACARTNGVDARRGDLFGPLPAALRGRVDLVTAVVPYVPTAALAWLQRDTFTHESALAYDGGPDGTAILRRAIEGSRAVLRPGGALLLELGGIRPGGSPATSAGSASATSSCSPTRTAMRAGSRPRCAPDGCRRAVGYSPVRSDPRPPTAAARGRRRSLWQGPARSGQGLFSYPKTAKGARWKRSQPRRRTCAPR